MLRGFIFPSYTIIICNNFYFDTIFFKKTSSIRVLDIVKAYEQATGIKINYKIVDRRPGDIDECYANPEKAAKVLGWYAENNIEDMCRDAWNWQRQNPQGY